MYGSISVYVHFALTLKSLLNLQNRYAILHRSTTTIVIATPAINDRRSVYLCLVLQCKTQHASHYRPDRRLIVRRRGLVINTSRLPSWLQVINSAHSTFSVSGSTKSFFNILLSSITLLDFGCKDISIHAYKYGVQNVYTNCDHIPGRGFLGQLSSWEVPNYRRNTVHVSQGQTLCRIWCGN